MAGKIRIASLTPEALKKLRAKSKIHSMIIDTKTGRRKTDTFLKKVLEKIKNGNVEWWPKNGTRAKRSYEFIISDLKKLNKKKPLDILVLGPGQGYEVTFIKKQLTNPQSNIDTLGLTNYLSKEANRIKRNDYSPKVPSDKAAFEHFNHLKLVRKYDYILSEIGPGVHTPYPEIVLLKAAAMLRKGGVARIRVLMLEMPEVFKNINNYLKLNGLQDNVKLKCDNSYIIINRLK